jgi:hypothetical protein
MVMRILLAALCCAPAIALGQATIDLTGKPISSIQEAFTKISGVVELSPTLVVATDNMEAKVVLVDFARGTVRQLGAKGQGPNEYRYPSPPIATPNGAIVFDTYQRRAISIGRNGALTGMKQLPDGALSRARGSDASGRIYFEGSDFDPNTGRFSDSLPVLRWDPVADHVDPITRVWGGGRVILQSPAGSMSMAREITPFPHLNAWVALPDGRVAVVRRDTFRIEFIAPGEARAIGATLPSRPIAVTATERSWYRDRNTPQRRGAMMIGGGTGQQSAARQFEDGQFPADMPPFIAADLIATPEGEIWIPRSFTSADKTRRYEIYDAAGKLAGTAIVDASARIVGFGAKSVYIARTNPDDDLVYLMKYGR